MDEKQRVKAILDRLDETYGTDMECYLHHENAWQLLVATMLSAQCTDERVNQVTPALFARYDSLEKLAQADIRELEAAIHATGFYHNKAKNIKACAQKIVSEYGGEVPSDMEALTALPGVGRKTANVVRSHCFDLSGVIVDTHVGRISRRLGFTRQEDPVKVEFELMQVLPEDHWSLSNLQLIALGRTICQSRKPKCEDCFLKDLCPSANS